MIMKDWVYIGAHVERPDGLIDKIIRITEDKGILLEMGTRYYCRTELKPFKDKPTKTELIDKAIDDLGGDISNANYHGRGYNNLWRNGSNYCLAADDSIAHIKGDTFCTIEEFEQRKKEREMKKNGDTGWYDYDKERNTSLPPIDTVCEYTLSDGRTWYKCKVISHNNLVLDCPHLESMDNNGLQVLRTDANTVKFRPLDWDKLSERKHVVEKAQSYMNRDYYSYMDIIETLYDAGMLKLPESK
jgi:hypothetical protein